MPYPHLLRYSYHPKQMSREKASTLVAVDQNRDLALCIAKRKGPKEELEAVGRYFYIDQNNSAEVAFIVREMHQSKGMAKALLDQMIKVAKKRNIARMCAYVRAENKAMLKVFKQHEFVRIPSESPRDITLELELKVDPQEQGVAEPLKSASVA